MSARILRACTLGFFVAACNELSGPGEPVDTIELAPIGDVWVGESRTLQATVRAADGTPLVGRPITWSSNNSAIAGFDAAGMLTAFAAGNVRIAATCEGRRVEADIVVSAMDLIYEGFLGGASEMLVLSLAGGGPSRVLPSGVVVSGPVASPDGSRIAFVAAEVGDAASDIYVVNRDGTGLYRLTDDPELDDNPAWSPDGAKIAFRSFRTGRLGDIWVVNVDGSNPVNLTPDPLPDTTDERRPAWSPDGTRIAFSSNRAGTFDIWTMRADGTNLSQHTNTVEYDIEPTWSPEGGRIAFRRSDDDTSDILIISLGGGQPIRMTHPGHELMPSWSPDGRYIAYAHFGTASEKPQIFTVRPDGAERTLRTTDPDWNGGIEPRWIRR